ncbi:MAG: hypothetical protein ACYSVY_28060 [Planctomycetota bacterium]|jgi:hypothetical protein
MSYQRPSRLRRVLKWAGLGVCALLVVLWGVSSKRFFFYGAETHLYSLEEGEFLILVVYARDHSKGFSTGRVFAADENSLFYCESWLPDIFSGAMEFAVILPIWMLAVVVAIPTSLLWYRDRRPPKGCCQGCGYNLRGNVSGVCPECGVAR